MSVSIFCTNLPETFLIPRISEGDTTTSILAFMQSTLYSCQILMKLELSRQIFEVHSNIKFHETPFCGSGAVACGQTDGRI